MTANGIQQLEKALRSPQKKSLSALTGNHSGALSTEFQMAARTLNNRKNRQLKNLKVVETTEIPWL